MEADAEEMARMRPDWRRVKEGMTARTRIFIASAMQASCRMRRVSHVLLMAATALIGYSSVSAYAAPQYETGYSPATQAELDAAKQRRKELARQRINSIVYGKESSPADLSPRTLLSTPPPLPPAAKPIPSPARAYPVTVTPKYSPPVVYAPPAYTPPAATVTPYVPPPLPQPEHATPAPRPSIIPEMLQSQPMPAPVAMPAPPQTEAVAPKMDAPASMPWHAASEPPPAQLPAPETGEAPKLTETAPDLIMPDLPPGAVQQGVVSDKSYIVAPGSPPPPSSPPLEPPVSESTTEAAVLPEVSEAIEATHQKHVETLAPETEEILDALPVDIIGRATSRETPGEFSVDRMDPAVALPDLGEDSPEVTSSETSGMKVAVKKRPVDVNYELEKAYVALTGGNTEEAIATYNNVLDIAPENEQALFGLATTYHRVGLLDKARPVYGKLLKINPRHKEAINNFLVMVGEEAPERALEHMKHLALENPDFAPIPAQMALLYSKIGDMQSAIQSMQQAVSIAPENLIYKYNLAILYDQANKPVEASILYKQLLEARYRGETLPADADEIQQRLTFLLSNK